MPPEIWSATLVAGLLMAVALPVYFACRRRWVMARWMIVGPLIGFGVATYAASFFTPRLGALPPADPNAGSGVFILAGAVATYPAGPCGAVAGSILCAVAGHYRERAAGQCPSQRARPPVA